MLKRIFIVFGVAVLFMAIAPAQQCYQNYPPGDDLFSTTSNVGIANNPGCANPMPVTLSGAFKVHRDPPRRPPDNRCEIPTEIIAMSQRDPSGQIRLRIQAPPNRSLGQIKQRVAGQDFPADSFFNVLFEVTGVPGITGTLFNRPQQPKRMASVISRIPPFKHVYEFPDCIPLYRREDPEPRQPKAWITANHRPQEPPVQQCYQDYPPGDDRFSTTSNVGIADNQNCANPTPVTLSGTFTVHRELPLRPPDNRCEIPTEIISMSQSDPSGRIQLRIQAPPNRSLGQIKQQVPGQDFNADSFFNVLFQVTGVPGITGTLFNKPENPKRMSSVISTIPPFKHVYEYPDCIPLYRLEDPEPRQPRAWITADHTPQPPQPPDCSSNPQVCGGYTPDCDPDVRPCYCFEVAEGGGNCVDDFFCSHPTCVDSSTCPPQWPICYVRTCCGVGTCGPDQPCIGQIQGQGDGPTATGKLINVEAETKAKKK